MAEVTIYTRKFCGFCSAAKALLKKKNASFTEFDATYDNALRQEMIQKANGASTFPQIFINGEHIGGSDDLHALDRAGKLEPMLAA